MIKVAFVSGPIDYSVCLANALSNECDVDFSYGDAYVKSLDSSILDLLDKRIKNEPVNSLRYGDPKNFLSYHSLAKRMRNYDVIHVQGSNIWLSLTRYLTRKVPIITTIHDPQPHSGLKLSKHLIQDLGQRLIVAQSTAFIVHGEQMKRDLAEHYRVNPERIHVLPHGEFSFYRQWQEKSDRLFARPAGKRILFFGAVRKNKGLDCLIKAEPLVSSLYQDYTICVAGKFESDPDNNLEHYRKQMANPSRYEMFNRFIANSEVADLVEQSDIVVLPYISATQSGVLPLAYGFGKPVVATDTGSISEVLRNGETGLLVPPGNVNALAEAITQLLVDDDLCRRMGENAATMARGQLNWTTIGQRTVELYRSIMKR